MVKILNIFTKSIRFTVICLANNNKRKYTYHFKTCFLVVMCTRYSLFLNNFCLISIWFTDNLYLKIYKNKEPRNHFVEEILIHLLHIH